MQIFNQLGGIELASAYKLIKAISKKQVEVIAKFKPEFIRGAVAQGVTETKALELFELILRFGGYGFNKSHSTRYAIVAFQTAYLKTYYPLEYMSALLTYEMGSTDKVVEYIDECRRVRLPDGSRGITVLPPDINESDRDFTPVYGLEGRPGVGGAADEVTGGRRARNLPAGTQGDVRGGVIRFGLCAVKGIGEKLVDEIIRARRAGGRFTSLHDFCERCDTRTVQKSSIELLIRCGAFGSLKTPRAAMLAGLDRAFEAAQRIQEDRRAGQLSMFGGESSPTRLAVQATPLPDVPEFPPGELLRFEKELLGFYITSHPLTSQRSKVEALASHTTRQALEAPEGTEVVLGVMVSAVRSRIAKSGRNAGQKWAIVEFEDFDGKIEGMCFAETYAALQQRDPELLKPERIVFVRGKVDRKRETPSLLVSDVLPVDEAVSKLTAVIGVELDASRHGPEIVEALGELTRRHAGRREWFVIVSLGDRVATFKVNGDRGVRITQTLLDELESLVGPGSVRLKGIHGGRSRRAEPPRRDGSIEYPEASAAPSTDGPAGAIAEDVVGPLASDADAATLEALHGLTTD